VVRGVAFSDEGAWVRVSGLGLRVWVQSSGCGVEPPRWTGGTRGEPPQRRASRHGARPDEGGGAKREVAIDENCWRYMTLGRCPLSISCSRGTPHIEVDYKTSVTMHRLLKASSEARFATPERVLISVGSDERDTHTHTHTYTHRHKHIHTHMHTFIHTHKHTLTLTHTHTQTSMARSAS